MVMQVKAQGLLNAGKYIEATFGTEALEGLLREASDETRSTYASGIAINWHPITELCELVDLAERRFGDGSGKVAQAIGAASARANLSGLVARVALYVAKPEFLMKRVASMWKQFNDEGEMVLVESSQRHMLLELRAVSEPRVILCQVMTGWVGEIATGIGAEIASLRHTSCRARGDARCLWELRGHVPQ